MSDPITPPAAHRTAEVHRATKETSIDVAIDLDGTGTTEVSTGLPFFDHMVSQLGRHGGFDLDVSARGDLEVDAHHTVEDVGITLGEVLAEALGDKAGIRRFGSVAVPLDEALIEVALDLSGRPFLTYDIEFPPGHHPAGDAAVRPAAGRGVLAGLRHLGRPDPPRAAAHRQEHPPHPRGVVQGGGPGPA